MGQKCPFFRRSHPATTIAYDHKTENRFVRAPAAGQSQKRTPAIRALTAARIESSRDARAVDPHIWGCSFPSANRRNPQQCLRKWFYEIFAGSNLSQL
jgi:hypothetical protein